MSLMEHLRRPDINKGYHTYRTTPDAMLVDVRTEEEYRQGHLPGSINLPLHILPLTSRLPDRADMPLFLYCRSGARSAQAAAMLASMGYTRVANIGGILSYQGDLEN